MSTYFIYYLLDRYYSLFITAIRYLSFYSIHRNLAHHDIVLPSQPDDSSGSVVGSYHSSCYRKFTALPQKARTQNPEEPQSRQDPTGQGTSSSTRSGTTALFSKKSRTLQKKCIFCGQDRKQVGGQPQKLIQCLTHEFATTLKNEALKNQDFDLLGLLENDLIAKEAYYHNSCRLSYWLQLNTTMLSHVLSNLCVILSRRT